MWIVYSRVTTSWSAERVWKEESTAANGTRRQPRDTSTHGAMRREGGGSHLLVLGGLRKGQKGAPDKQRGRERNEEKGGRKSQRRPFRARSRQRALACTRARKGSKPAGRRQADEQPGSTNDRTGRQDLGRYEGTLACSLLLALEGSASSKSLPSSSPTSFAVRPSCKLPNSGRPRAGKTPRALEEGPHHFCADDGEKGEGERRREKGGRWTRKGRVDRGEGGTAARARKRRWARRGQVGQGSAQGGGGSRERRRPQASERSDRRRVVASHGERASEATSARTRQGDESRRATRQICQRREPRAWASSREQSKGLKGLTKKGLMGVGRADERVGASLS